MSEWADGWGYWLLVGQSAWLASICGIVAMWLMGNRIWWAPWFGLFGQAFWLILALYTEQLGLLVAVAFYGGVYLRNGVKWWRERERLAGVTRGE